MTKSSSPEASSAAKLTEASPDLQKKYDLLKDYLRSLGKVAVAFSGGVDSTLLLYAALEAQELQGNNVLAITASSLAFPVRETQEATDYCKSLGVRQITFSFDEFAIEGFRENPPHRCYLCKQALFGQILAIAQAEGFGCVVEGSNLDDLDDYRPGLQALRELGIKSPLQGAQLTKAEIRTLSELLGIPTWNKQSFACLATRFPYGQALSEEGLKMVDQAEQYLLEQGFHQVRVRVYDKLARIEVQPKELKRLTEDPLKEQVINRFRKIGFDYVTLDLEGYRSGSMNIGLDV